MLRENSNLTIRTPVQFGDLKSRPRSVMEFEQHSSTEDGRRVKARYIALNVLADVGFYCAMLC